MVRSASLAIALALVAGCGDVAPSDRPASSAEGRVPVPSASAPATPAATPQGSTPALEPWLNDEAGLTFSEQSADLGVVAERDTVTDDVVLRNGYREAVTGLAISLEPTEGSRFAILAVGAPCDGGTMPVQSSCRITVRFDAGASAASSAELRAEGTGGRSQRVVRAVTPLTAAVTAWTTTPIPESVMPQGAGLAYGTDGERPILHAITSTLGEVFERRVGGELVVDDASAYQRSDDGGATWGKAQVMGGFGPAIAASGDDVFVVMRAYDCDDGPGITHNDRGGARGSWSSTTCLAGDYGQHATVAATGPTVIVATAASRGKGTWIHVSHDRGRTWTHERLASTGHDPLVAASGRLVVVAVPEWGGGSEAWVSRDRARTWEALEGIPAGFIGAIDVRSGRIAIAGSEPGDGTTLGAPWLRWWSADGTAHDAALPAAADGSLDVRALALGPGGAIGMVAAPERCTSWFQSLDGGATWSTDALPDCSETPVAIVGEDGVPIVLGQRSRHYLVQRGPAMENGDRP